MKKIVNCYEKKEFKIEDEIENLVVRDHCPFIGKFGALEHDEGNLGTRKKYVSFVPIFFPYFSGNESHLIFDQVIKILLERKIGKKGDDNRAKLTDNHVSVKRRYSNFYRYF